MVRVYTEDGRYGNYLHDSRSDDKSDLSARPNTIEMRGRTASATVIGKDRDLPPRQE